VSDDNHEHDWHLLDAAITNTSNSRATTMPSKVSFVCPCGKYKVVKPEKIKQERESWLNTGKTT